MIGEIVHFSKRVYCLFSDYSYLLDNILGLLIIDVSNYIFWCVITISTLYYQKLQNFKQGTSTKFYTIFCCTWSNQQHRLFAYFGKLRTCKVCTLFYNFASLRIYPFVHIKVTSFTISTRYALVKHGCPGSNKVKIWQTYLSPTFWHPRGAWDVSEVWGSNRWTYSPSLFTVSSTIGKL